MIAQEKALHIDIPVKLAEVKVVFSVAWLSFEGDLTASLFHLQLMVDGISNWKAKSEVVVVFHTNASHVTLHDQACNPRDSTHDKEEGGTQLLTFLGWENRGGRALNPGLSKDRQKATEARVDNSPRIEGPGFYW